MGRFANSWSLTKASFAVVRQDKELLILPILSFLASVVAFLAVVGIGFGARILPQVTDPVTGSPSIASLLLAFVLYLALAFVQVFFGAAVVAGANTRLSGGNPTLGSCLGAASRRLGRLLAWSAIVATVNIIMQLLRERGGQAGRLVAGLGNMAWGLATFFMLPILMFENVPLIPAIGRSGSLFKKTWGETVIGNGGVGFVFGIAIVIVAVIGLLVGNALYSTGGLLAVLPVAVLVLAAIVILATLGSVIGLVYRTALYRFATTGEAGGGFTPQQLGGAFHGR